PNLGLYIQVADEESSGNRLPAGANDYEALISAHEPAPRIERSPDDQFLSYTGGTTGLPKGVMVNLGKVISRVAFLGPMLGLTEEQAAAPVATAVELAKTGRRLISIPASPLMHSTGFQMTALPTLAFGGAVVTLTSRSLNPHELIDTVERERVR